MATERIECEGVVLNAMAYGESDRIIRIYTERMGKLSVMAKGAKSRRSRYLPLSEVFTYGRFRLSRGKTFYYLNSGKILQSNLPMRDNYDRLIYGSALVEIVDKSSLEGEGTPRIFSLIRKAVHELSIETRPIQVFLAFLIKYVSFMGYRPLIHDEGGPFYFSPDKGVSADGNHPRARPVDERDIYTIRHLLYTPLDKIHLDHVPEETVEKMYRLLTDYVLTNLDLDTIQSLQLRM